MSRLPFPRRARPTTAVAVTTLAALLALVAPVRAARAQDAGAVASVSVDTLAIDAVLARARRLATDGDMTGARRALDSLARALDVPGPASAPVPRLAELLFWRATWARTAADAERDYRRLVVEHPMSPRSGDALLRLAQLELARGDQALAVRHLERLVLEHPESPNRARARYWTGRAWLDAGDVPKACGALGDALRWAASADVELRNQVRHSAQRCPRGWDAVATAGPAAPATVASAPVETTVVAPRPVAQPPVTTVMTPPVTTPVVPALPAMDSAATRGGPPPNTTIPPAPRESVTTRAPVVPPARVDTGSRGAPPKTNIPLATPAPVTTSAPAAAKPPATAATPTRTAWAVQVAAYDTRPDAEGLVRRLAARGVTARVSGDVKPFRVRTGQFATRAAAAAHLATLKGKGIAGFVVDEPVPATGGSR